MEQDAGRAAATGRRLATIYHEDGPGGLLIAATCLRHADLAAALATLDPAMRGRVFVGLPPDLAGEALEEMEPALRDELLESADDQRLLKILAEADADDAVYFLDHLDEARAEHLLAQMDAKLREDLSEQYELPDHSVGRIMNRSVILLRSFMTAGQAIAHLQGTHQADALPLPLRALYVIDAEGKLVGVLGFRELLFAQPRALLPTIMEREPIIVTPEADREEAARVMQKYNLVSLPVVDHNGHVKGVVTVDDIVEVVQEAATEDMQKMSAMETLGAPYLQVPFLTMVRKRAGWLSLLFVGEMLTASVMARFEEQVAAQVVLAMFIPLIISSGGNSGSQATTLVIRSLALREIHLAQWWRVLVREIGSGIALGLILGLIGFVRIGVWHVLWPNSAPAYGSQFLAIGTIVLCSLVGIVLWGSVAGAMLPFVLRLVRLDPASASAPLVATLVDVTGLVIYFTVARVVFGLFGQIA